MLPVQTTDLQAMPQQPLEVTVDILLLLLVLQAVYLPKAFLNKVGILHHKWVEDTMLLQAVLLLPLSELQQFSIRLQLLLDQLSLLLDLLELPLGLLVDLQVLHLPVIMAHREDQLLLMLRRLLADPPVLLFSPHLRAPQCLPLRLLPR